MSIGWSDLNFWNSPRWRTLQELLKIEPHFPATDCVFRALSLTPLNKTRVLILGQDPYHTGCADGLAFSVQKKTKIIPPSLRNIINEVNTDMNYQYPVPVEGPLDGWAKQGVLLINSVFTVCPHKPASHATWGWQDLTKEIIETVAEINDRCVFVFWGNYAQKFEEHTYGEGHTIKSPHPSPYSAHQGFLGSRPFTKINNYLINSGEAPIDWTRMNDYY